MKSELHPKPPPAGYDWTDYIPFCALLETRRAVRTGGFVLCFWGCNVVVMLAWLAVSLLPLLDAGQQHVRLDPEAYFKVSVDLVFLFVLPATALFSVSGDIKSGAMELLLLTGVNPLNVLVGKLLAKLMEAVLMCCILLPYALLYYFVTGVNPLLQAVFMLAVVTLSLKLCAFAVALSLIRSLIVRLSVALVVMPMALGAGASVLYTLLSLATNNFIAAIPLLGLFVVIFVFLPLCVGACTMVRNLDRPIPGLHRAIPDLSFPGSTIKKTAMAGPVTEHDSP